MNNSASVPAPRQSNSRKLPKIVYGTAADCQELLDEDGSLALLVAIDHLPGRLAVMVSDRLDEWQRPDLELGIEKMLLAEPVETWPPLGDGLRVARVLCIEYRA